MLLRENKGELGLLVLLSLLFWLLLAVVVVVVTVVAEAVAEEYNIFLLEILQAELLIQ
jgi:hypothetical protein